MSNLLQSLFNLKKGEDNKDRILENVKSGISFRGANLWILACAIIVASVGLNVNSTAVVIGAMLISPLMGPIVGAGFALGIYDFTLLRKSLKNLLISTLVGLIFSAIYFFISPFKEPSEEILARTAPNLYDVLIAFFGGLVGVIAITRVEKGNPIPGVAIATALMPPLCTAGFGLATGNFSFFFGAMYLYVINCVFICISTFLIVKYLGYPSISFVNEKRKKTVTNLIWLIIFLMIIPSSYFAFTLYREQQFRQQTEKFITTEFLEKGNTLVYKKLNYIPQNKTIELGFLSRTYDSIEIKKLESQLPKYGLNETKLVIRKNTASQLNQMKNDILNEVSTKDKELADLKATIKQTAFDNVQLKKELNVFFPEITETAFEKGDFAVGDSISNDYVLMIRSENSLGDSDVQKLRDFVQNKFNVQNVRVLQIQ